MGRAQFQGADLDEAQFQHANLGRAQFQRSNLGRAQFRGADLFEADLQHAYLGGGQLRGVRGLTVEQLHGAVTDRATAFDDQLIQSVTTNLRRMHAREWDCPGFGWLLARDDVSSLEGSASCLPRIRRSSVVMWLRLPVRVISRGRQVARSFGISESCLARWLRIAEGEDGPPPRAGHRLKPVAS